MDYPEFNKRIGEKIAILTFSGITKCATEAFKLLINFQFPSKPPNSWHSRKFEDNQWQIRSWIQTPLAYGSSPSITTWLRRSMALISLTVPSKVLSSFTLKRRRLILFFFFLFFVNFFKCLILEIEFSIEKKVKLISQFSKYILQIFTLFLFFGGAKLQLPS